MGLGWNRIYHPSIHNTNTSLSLSSWPWQNLFVHQWASCPQWKLDKCAKGWGGRCSSSAEASSNFYSQQVKRPAAFFPDVCCCFVFCLNQGVAQQGGIQDLAWKDSTALMDREWIGPESKGPTEAPWPSGGCSSALLNLWEGKQPWRLAMAYLRLTLLRHSVTVDFGGSFGAEDVYTVRNSPEGPELSLWWASYVHAILPFAMQRYVHLLRPV